MQGVLISIQPKWCELIASEKKTVEVRKTKPKLETPFKVYIYCTQDKRLLRKFDKGERIDDEHFFDEHVFVRRDTWIRGHIANGKVIGEFVCHNISEFESELWDDETYERITRVVHTKDWEGYPETESYYVAEDGEDNYLCRQSCLTWEDLRGYVGQDFNTFFGWHISDLVIYDKPRELSEFYTIDNEAVQKCEHRVQSYFDGYCDSGCLKCGFYCSVKDDWCDKCKTKPITRPPQSWCYVEVQE